MWDQKSYRRKLKPSLFQYMAKITLERTLYYVWNKIQQREMTKIHKVSFGCSVWNVSALPSWQNEDLKLMENFYSG